MTTLKVLDALVAARGHLSGADIARGTGLASGTLYPLLLRIEKAGWVTSDWEAGDPSLLGRPHRRYYVVTSVGVARTRRAAADLAGPVGRLAWSPS